MNKSIKFWAIVPAAGVGKRMQANRPKQYLELNNQTVIEQTLSRLLAADIFEKIVVAISKEDGYWQDLVISKHSKIQVAKGGKERADSVLSALNAIQSIANLNDWVLVHDAARPCVTPSDILHLIASLKKDEIGGILAQSSHDTLKFVENNTIQKTLNRHHIWRALTPQMFRFSQLKNALEQTQGNVNVTDEASALEMLGYAPKIVEGRGDNLKITRPEDLALAQFYLENQANECEFKIRHS